jgi:hypothetical protein
VYLSLKRILILRTCRLERRLHELQRACVAETEAEAKKQGTLSALASIFSGKMTCDLTATLVYKDNWPQPIATFCDGLAGPKYLVSQSHSCALFPGCGISFCDGFVNSAKPLLANRHTKFALEVEFPPCGFFLRGGANVTIG